MTSGTQIVKLPVSKLIKAHWNYKTDGTEEQIQKLQNAIKFAKSCGVLAVREIRLESGDWVFEVMDGNHRLDAIKREGWKEVPCENFGQIDEAQAVIVTRQRNQNWFDDDKLKLANLFNDIVFPEFEKDFLANILPETIESLDTLALLANAEWETPEKKDPTEGTTNITNEKKIFITVPEETFNLWMKWKARLQEACGIEEDSRAFEYAVIEALNVPEEQWAKRS